MAKENVSLIKNPELLTETQVLALSKMLQKPVQKDNIDYIIEWLDDRNVELDVSVEQMKKEVNALLDNGIEFNYIHSIQNPYDQELVVLGNVGETPITYLIKEQYQPLIRVQLIKRLVTIANK